MNGFLVVVRCGMDDLPVRLIADEEAAMSYASAVPAADVALVKKTLVLDTSVFHGTGVVLFVNGQPVGYRHVLDFDDMDEADVPEWAA